jgi:hypothetical protein
MDLFNDDTLEITNKRTGKEIKIDGKYFNNCNANFKIGTTFNKEKPETIFIETSFWIDVKDKENYYDKYSFFNYDYELSKKLSYGIRKIYRNDLKNFLENNFVFPFYLENIFVYDFPENINYNDKRSFVSIELNIHTLNCMDNCEKEYPLNDKEDNILFNEAKKVCEIIANSDLLKGNLDFTIHKRKKD